MLLVRRNNYSNWLNDWFDNSFFDTEEVPQYNTPRYSDNRLG